MTFTHAKQRCAQCGEPINAAVSRWIEDRHARLHAVCSEECEGAFAVRQSFDMRKYRCPQCLGQSGPRFGVCRMCNGVGTVLR